MAPRKLSDSDKQNITQLYCQPGETTSTLATKFGVSSSTVSRVLKQMLSDDDYSKLMQWKRSGERSTLELMLNLPVISDTSEAAKPTVAEAPLEDVAEVPPEDIERTTSEIPEAIETSSKKTTQRRSRRRPTAQLSDEASSREAELPSVTVESISEDSGTSEVDVDKAPNKIVKESDRVDDEITGSDAAAWVSEGLAEEDDYDEDDDEDDDWDEDDWDDESDEEEDLSPPTPRQEALLILSFDDFVVKKPCYLVVDRLAELITCPLREFAELGLIPVEEEQARTLPVFDNHRVARRFARRNQRIIKVPNGLMLNKTQQYLQAKGISRLLFDGQVYALN